MSVDKLARLNGISTRSTIRPGQRLKVSGTASSVHTASSASSSATGEYRVRYGDSLWSIARSHGTSVKELAGLNGISSRATIKPGQRLKVAGTASISSGSRTYKVRNGDTIWDIAQRHGVSTESILRANNLSRRSVIKPGQRLVIPAGGSA